MTDNCEKGWVDEWMDLWVQECMEGLGRVVDFLGSK